MVEDGEPLPEAREKKKICLAFFKAMLWSDNFFFFGGGGEGEGEGTQQTFHAFNAKVMLKCHREVKEKVFFFREMFFFLLVLICTQPTTAP